MTKRAVYHFHWDLQQFSAICGFSVHILANVIFTVTAKQYMQLQQVPSDSISILISENLSQLKRS